MKKISKNSINWALKIMTLAAFSLLILPIPASARNYGTNYSFGKGHDFDETYVPDQVVYREVEDNPKPMIYWITPKAADWGATGNTITIMGKNFIPSSVARVNGVNRATTFIDSSHLLLRLTGPDLYRTDGGFYVTVWNPAPGGGYSNSEFFTINNGALPNTAERSGTGGTPVSNDPNLNYNMPNPAGEQFRELTSTAVFGAASFLPSGLIQWVLVAIVILLLIIMGRKMFGSEEGYHAAPLKHD